MGTAPPACIHHQFQPVNRCFPFRESCSTMGPCHADSAVWSKFGCLGYGYLFPVTRVSTLEAADPTPSHVYDPQLGVGIRMCQAAIHHQFQQFNRFHRLFPFRAIRSKMCPVPRRYPLSLFRVHVGCLRSGWLSPIYGTASLRLLSPLAPYPPRHRSFVWCCLSGNLYWMWRQSAG
jgi:hypothetical protein